MEKVKPNDGNPFSKQIGEKEIRKMKSLKGNKRSEWLGLGMFGMVGWSVALSTVAGAILGIWLDKRYPQTFSWTLSLLLAGLVTGSAIAWNWVAKEHDQMHKNRNEK